METEETWQTIKDARGYEVSNLGRVRNSKTGRIMKASARGAYQFHNQGKPVTLSINRIRGMAEWEREHGI